MADYGIKILKQNAQQTNPKLKDFYLNSEKVLLKIHKQGSFKGRFVRFEGFTVTIRFDDLGYRPLVMVYCQRITHDVTPVVDPTYHLLDWEYNGATKLGYQRVKVYNNRFTLEYLDQIVDDNGGNLLDCFGYYYIFKEEV